MRKNMQVKAQTLAQRLGQLDKERREVLNQLRKTPEYSIQYLKQALDSIISENSSRWYSRSNAKNENAYFKLVSYEIVPVTPTRRTSRKLTAPVKQVTINITKHKSVLTKVKLNWKYFGYNATSITDQSEEISISVFKDLVPQILNGRVLAKKFDEKSIVRATLTAKKNELEAQLKKVKDEIAAVK
jgi:hypothetical protein